MESLESYYQSENIKISYLDRRIDITASRTLIYGAPKSGKTYLLLHHISQFKKKEVLYLDLSDPRIDRYVLPDHLPDFILKHKITHLALDNYDGSFPLPDAPHLYISSDTVNTLPDFETVHLYSLDFEEFVAFDTRHSNITQSFNTYIKEGSFPEIPFLPENKKIPRLQEILQLICLKDYEYLVLSQLIQQMGQSITIYQQFSQLKLHTKISKDKFYATCKKLEEQEIIFMISKYAQPNAPKKLYIYDHALKSAITFEKDFLGIIENMVFMELYKHGKRPTYLEGVDFYLEESAEAIIDSPFATEESLKAKMAKIHPVLEQQAIQKVIFITVSFEMFDSTYKGIQYDAMPFFMWALGE